MHLFEDTGTATPDAVFPNNWFSTHAGGQASSVSPPSQSPRSEDSECSPYADMWILFKTAEGQFLNAHNKRGSLAISPA